jgi:hypothetical protein
MSSSRDSFEKYHEVLGIHVPSSPESAASRRCVVIDIPAIPVHVFLVQDDNDDERADNLSDIGAEEDSIVLEEEETNNGGITLAHRQLQRSITQTRACRARKRQQNRRISESVST